MTASSAAAGAQNFDLWIDGQRLASASSTLPVQTDNSYVLIGSERGTTLACEGWIRQVRILPYVLSDAAARRASL